jgi:RNHCP domain
MTGPKLFQRTKEDFVCEQCETHVTGDGYTNHCSQCLWSKHVDINPGDRSAGCGGAMKPVWIEYERQDTVLTHECVLCKYRKRNKVSKYDSIDAQVLLSKSQHM